MQKCLVFGLPSGAGWHRLARGGIQKKLKELVNSKQIGSNIKTKTQGYTFKVWLEHESDYTIFFLVWTPVNTWQKPKVIEENYTEDQ